MRLRTVSAMLCLAAFMLCSASAASAALPEFLVSSGGLPVKFTGTAGLTRFQFTGAITLECLKTAVTGEVTSSHGGTYKFDVEGCRATGGLECHTTGDASGVLLWAGEFHFVRIALSPTKVGLLMSLPTLTSSCFGEFATHENKGFVLPITPINTFATNFSMTAVQKEGIQEFTAYYNESGTLISGAYLLLTSGPKQFAIETTFSLTMERSSEILA